MQFVSLARRILGATLVALVVLPVYRILGLRETGLAGEATIALSDLNAGLLWSGALVALIPAIVLARIVKVEQLEAWLRRAGGLLLVPKTGVYATALAILAGFLTFGFSLFVLDGKPNIIDAMAQLLHARYLAAGKLAGPITPESAFWYIHNTVLTPNGWVSQYPPGHVVLLAAGFRLGSVQVVPAILVGLTILFTALVAERLLVDDRRVARLGTLFLTVSPFVIALAGSYMNHITAAAAGTMAIYFAVRARDGHLVWAVPTGTALAWAFGTRPLSALAFGATVAFAVWLSGPERGKFAFTRWMSRMAGAVLGALPILIGLGIYNAYFFGSPFRFGYELTHGETTRLGFHRDPWGNWYGPIEALAYTSADLVALNLNLIESAIPIVVFAGVFLIISQRLSDGERIVAAWALLPVLANVLYWHHGLLMGPRMLNEAAPAWALLAAVGVVGVASRVPRTWSVLNGKYSIRVALATFLLMGGGLGFLVLAPRRALSYGGDWQTSTRIQPPEVSEPSVVFVHGGWTSRIAVNLATQGMRIDSVETALRQNPSCAVHMFALAYQGITGNGPQAALDFNPRSTGFPPEVEISPGNRIRVEDGTHLSAECMRQVEADRNGVIDVSPLIWQGDLPGIPGKGALFIRDMGPEMNAGLIRQLPDRTPMVLYTPSPDDSPILVPYDEGMAAIWTRTTDE